MAASDKAIVLSLTLVIGLVVAEAAYLNMCSSPSPSPKPKKREPFIILPPPENVTWSIAFTITPVADWSSGIVPIADSYQREMVEYNGRTWFWYYNQTATKLGYSSTTDGVNFQPFYAVGDTRPYRISVDDDENGNMYLAWTNGTANIPLYFMCGAMNVTDGTVSWNSSFQAAVPAEAGITFTRANIQLDSAGYPYIGYQRWNDSYSEVCLTKSKWNNGTWETDTTGEAEAITNGGFETGDMTGWTVDGTSIEGEEVFEGSYSAWIHYENMPNWISQALASQIPVSTISAFTARTKIQDTEEEIYLVVHVTYSDDSYTEFEYYPTIYNTWEEIEILSHLTSGKTVKAINLTRPNFGGQDGAIWVDEVSLIYGGFPISVSPASTVAYRVLPKKLPNQKMLIFYGYASTYLYSRYWNGSGLEDVVQVSSKTLYGGTLTDFSAVTVSDNVMIGYLSSEASQKFYFLTYDSVTKTYSSESVVTSFPGTSAGITLTYDYSNSALYFFAGNYSSDISQRCVTLSIYKSGEWLLKDERLYENTRYNGKMLSSETVNNTGKVAVLAFPYWPNAAPVLLSVTVTSSGGDG